MMKKYETPAVEIDQVSTDVITTSDWELPRIDWETDEKEQNDW